MKNIFVLPTTQPSRLWINNLLQGKLELSKETLIGSNTAQHMYITSDEEIRKNDYYIHNNRIGQSAAGEQEKGDYKNCKKIILTTDSTLIAEGVQSIDDEFLEWFVKNPSCGFIKVTKLDYLTNRQYRIYNLPQEEPKQEKEEEWKELEGANLCEPLKSWEDDKQSTLEEVAEKYSQGWGENDDVKSFIAGGKHMAERMYSKEEVNEIISAIWISCEDNEGETFTEVRKRILEQFKKK
jgi:hypothetical protein